MQFTLTIEGETAADLIKRVYGRLDDRQNKIVLDHLRRENPILRDLDKLPGGRIITIPQIPDVIPVAAQTERTFVAAVGRLGLKELGDIAKTLGARVDQRKQRAENAFQTLEKALRDPDVKKLHDSDGTFRERVAKIDGNLKAELERVGKLQPLVERAAKELENDIDSLLREKFEGTSGQPPGVSSTFRSHTR